MPAVAGIAVFTGCSISKPGIGLRLVASAEGADDVWSFPINVWAAGSPRGPEPRTDAVPGRDGHEACHAARSWRDAVPHPSDLPEGPGAGR